VGRLRATLVILDSALQSSEWLEGSIELTRRGSPKLNWIAVQLT